MHQRILDRGHPAMPRQLLDLERPAMLRRRPLMQGRVVVRDQRTRGDRLCGQRIRLVTYRRERRRGRVLSGVAAKALGLVGGSSLENPRLCIVSPQRDTGFVGVMGLLLVYLDDGLRLQRPEGPSSQTRTFGSEMRCAVQSIVERLPR
jgi:hypothetical protein